MEIKNKGKQGILIVATAILMIMLTLLSISLASALGISPGEKKIAYSAGSVETIKYTIINNENKNFVVSINADGEISEYVNIKDKQLTLSSNEATKDFYVEVNMPPGLHPGENTGRIIAEESIENLSFMGTSGKGRIRVISKLVVLVPYPEKYINVELNLGGDAETEITTKITNLGITDIKEIGGELGIYEDESEIINLKPEFVGGLERSKETILVSKINREEIPNGLYSVVAKIRYDDYILEVSRDFEIGDGQLKVMSYTRYLLQDSVNKFEIDVENDWNKKIKDAYSTINITQYNKEITELRSSSYDFNPREKKTMTAFWDTKDFALGDYQADMNIISLNKSTSKQGEVSIVDPETYKKLTAGSFFKSWIFIVIIVLVVIVILNIVFWFFIFKKRRK